MKPRANLRLDPRLHALLEDAAAKGRTTKTAILEDALSIYFDKDRNLPLEDRLMKRLDNFERRMGRLEWKMNLSIETVAHFVFYWLVRTHPLPPDDSRAAHHLGQRRFEHFIDQVSARLGKRRTLAQESLRWEGPDPD